MQGSSQNQTQSLAANRRSTQANQALISSALSCAKLGLVWDPTTTPATCIKTNPQLATTTATCTTGNAGQLRYNTAKADVEVGRVARERNQA